MAGVITAATAKTRIAVSFRCGKLPKTSPEGHGRPEAHRRHSPPCVGRWSLLRDGQRPKINLGDSGTKFAEDECSHLPLFWLFPAEATFGGDPSGFADFLRDLQGGIAERSSVGNDGTGRQRELQ